MRAILCAGDELPMALLFNRGVRLRANEDHQGRWITILLGCCYVEEVPAMRFDAQRSLLIKTEEMLDTVWPTLLIQ